MKKVLSISLLACIALMMTSSTKVEYPNANNTAFQIGEKLTYRISYGFIDAGEAVLELKTTSKKGEDGRELIHAKGVGKTLGAFNTFFKVHDVYESYLDKDGIFPWYFVRRVDEGGYKKSQDYAFKHNKLSVNNGEGKDFTVPMGIQDMISSFYYARTIDLTDLKVGKVFQFKCFMDDEIYPLKIKYIGKEVVSTRKGKVNCLKFVPIVQKGRYFKDPEDLVIWMSDDKNRVPIQVKAKIPVGSVKLHLVDYSGLKNSVNFVKETSK